MHMSTRSTTPSRRRAFTLLEVLVALTIVALTLSAVLRSLTISLKAVRQSERMTTATILARGLVDEWELKPPEAGALAGDFGDRYRGYSYEAECKDIPIDYKRLPKIMEVGRLAGMKQIAVDVYYVAPGSDATTRKRVLHIESALTGADKYTPQSRRANNLGYDD
jgi:prepilin-type N-terminal cleavage/methylation domain-containing protein